MKPEVIAGVVVDQKTGTLRPEVSPAATKLVAVFWICSFQIDARTADAHDAWRCSGSCSRKSIREDM